jgi:hypothetical protein
MDIVCGRARGRLWVNHCYSVLRGATTYGETLGLVNMDSLICCRTLDNVLGNYFYISNLYTLVFLDTTPTLCRLIIEHKSSLTAIEGADIVPYGIASGSRSRSLSVCGRNYMALPRLL